MQSEAEFGSKCRHVKNKNGANHHPTCILPYIASVNYTQHVPIKRHLLVVYKWLCKPDYNHL